MGMVALPCLQRVHGPWLVRRLGKLLDIGMGTAAVDTGGTDARTQGTLYTRGQSKTVDSHQQALRKLLLDLRQPQALNVATPRY